MAPQMYQISEKKQTTTAEKILYLNLTVKKQQIFGEEFSFLHLKEQKFAANFVDKLVLTPGSKPLVTPLIGYHRSCPK